STKGEFALGQALARAWQTPLALGPGIVVLEAKDRAGNPSHAPPLRFDACDVDVPVVAEVTGSAGEPVIGGRGHGAGLRAQRSAAGPRLRFSGRDPDDCERLTGEVSGPDARGSCHLQLAAAPAGEPFTSGLYKFAVEDAAGNRSEQRH